MNSILLAELTTQNNDSTSREKMFLYYYLTTKIIRTDLKKCTFNTIFSVENPVRK